MGVLGVWLRKAFDYTTQADLQRATRTKTRKDIKRYKRIFSVRARSEAREWLQSIPELQRVFDDERKPSKDKDHDDGEPVGPACICQGEPLVDMTVSV